LHDSSYLGHVQAKLGLMTRMHGRRALLPAWLFWLSPY